MKDKTTFSRPQCSWLALFVSGACSWPCASQAQLELVRDNEAQRIFAGDTRKIQVLWHNNGERSIEAQIRTRLYQASSATAVLIHEDSWKQLQILPGQTVRESAALSFPSVRAETRFFVQWLGEANKVLGKTEVVVYPPDLLKDFKTLAGD